MLFAARPYILRRFLGGLACLALLLAGCAGLGKKEEATRVGMHIDAQLEFAIAYPLDWTKERRAAWRTPAGSVIWLLPGPPGAATFEVVSAPAPPGLDDETQRLAAIRKRFPRLAAREPERVALEAGEALRLSGETTHGWVDAHLLRLSGRDFTLLFKGTAELHERHEKILAEMLESFRALPPRP